jgi:hypothetical protein
LHFIQAQALAQAVKDCASSFLSAPPGGCPVFSATTKSRFFSNEASIKLFWCNAHRIPAFLVFFLMLMTSLPSTNVLSRLDKHTSLAKFSLTSKSCSGRYCNSKKHHTKMNVLLVGTGEYTTGIVGSGQEQSKSDKRLGVVALCFFELRRLGSVGKRIVLCGTNGSKFPAIRTHFARNISARYNGLDVSFDQFPPNDEQRNAEAFRDAIASMQPGDLCVIFTPDDTHYEIAQTALQRGLHVLVTKPLVQRLQQHVALVELAKAKGVVLATEVHKRWDPMYR